MRILVVDDSDDIIRSFRKVLDSYTIVGAKSMRQAKEAFERFEDIYIAIIDVRLGEENGLDVLDHIKRKYPLTECIMISGYSTVDKAVKAIKKGAFDFLEKPISFQKLVVAVKNALEHRNYSKIIEDMRDSYRLVGKSPFLKDLESMIEKAASTDFPVLITGESGTGKEHVAHLIHLKSRHSYNEMVTVNCASIPENLLESELFGHVKGAFTDALRERVGYIERANDSTLFLDEIGEMPLSQQVKLLRVLENGEFSRVGDEKMRRSDFRLISATNRNLEESIERGSFREDLYYRISAIRIDVKPLRERREDIPILARYFLKKLNLEGGMGEKSFSEAALEYIRKLHFRGNVRELKNLVSRLYVLAEGEVITEREVSAIYTTESRGVKDQYGESIFRKTMKYGDAKRELERRYIIEQLELHGGNISRTAIALGMLPNNLVRKMKNLAIET